MNPLPYVFPYAPIFWAIMVWAFLPEFQIIRRAQKSVRSADSPDAGSYRVIVIGMWIAYLVAFPLGWVDALRFPKNWEIAIFVVGLVILIGGSLLRRHCWRMLGASFTGDVQARAGQHIVTSGAYKLLRHPSYTAGILMYAGIGLALGSWASAALLIVSSFATYGYRMAVEERALLSAVGEPYREFMRTRKRLIPYVY
jgi:protein-S-isoprenylcysteine O-methyltransferase Ste14